jgi:hypothetical protein
MAQEPDKELQEQTTSRYRRLAEGDDLYLECVDSPNIHLRVQWGLSVDEETREKYPRQTIFLDGAFNGPPFLDNSGRQYSLDHHAGNTPRSFLLATCEQAVVMVLDGLPLEEGEWQLYINDPDLDAVLAAWVLMNHAPLRVGGGKLLYHAMPLIRVEGVIDAHGTDKPVLSGFPQTMWEQYRSRIDDLRGTEMSRKESGEWAESDLTAYTCDLLLRLDQELLPDGELADLLEVEELGRVMLGQNKLAILCRSRQGIYAVEERLKERFGNRLALVVLDAGSGRFTLRQTDMFLPKNLMDLYAALNKADSNAADSDLWGGASDIGGSPRKAGSGLESEEVLEVVAEVFEEHKPLWQRLWPFD